MSDIVGRTLLGFRILAKIKDGGMSTVFKAQDPRDQIVAIKMINVESFESSEMRSALKREAQLTKTLVHPYIIRVFGYYEAEPRPFILEEYFESENLKFVLHHQPERIAGKSYRLMRQMAEALQYSNGQGVVHRDVKPENFLVSPAGDARLIDFSIAQTRWERLLTFGGKTKGTPLYMSPEQIAGKRLDARSDQYSFGAVLFEMMVKKPPFVGMTSTQILDKHLLATAPTLRSLDPTIPPEMDGMVAKMLSKEVGDRFPDLAQVIMYLRKCEKREEEVREREEIGRLRRSKEGSGRPGGAKEPTRAVPIGGGLPAEREGSAPLRTPSQPTAPLKTPGPGGGAPRKEPTRILKLPLAPEAGPPAVSTTKQPTQAIRVSPGSAGAVQDTGPAAAPQPPGPVKSRTPTARMPAPPPPAQGEPPGGPKQG